MNQILGIAGDIGLSVIVYLIAGFAAFFLIGIIFVVICGNKNIFKRHRKIWNFFTKLYYFYIPCVFALFGAVLVSLYGLNKAVNEQIEQQAPVLIEASAIYVPKFQSYVTENMAQLNLSDTNVDKVVDDFFNKNSVSSESGMLADIQNKLEHYMFKGFLEGLALYSAHQMGIESSTLGNTMQIVKGFDMKKVDKGFATVVLKTITKQVSLFFNTMYISQFMNLLLFLSIPIIEIIAYFVFLKPATVEQIA